jgi:glucose-1-phosphate thymidylyltransferase
VGLAISYLVLEDSPSPAHSVDAAFPFVGDSVVALGFPDVLLQVEDPFGAMLERWRVSESDVVLGLFPPAPDYPTERVDVDANGRILSLDPRAEGEDQRPTWTLAVWGPDFGRYLHDAVGAWDRQETEAIAAAAGGARASVTPPDELVLGRVFRAALQDGIGIDGVLVSEEPFVDIGDPDRLIGALRRAYGK